jgi:hypothetical protein
VRQDASADKAFNMGFAEANPCFVGDHKDFSEFESVSLGSMKPRHSHDCIWFQTKLSTTYATNSVHPTSLSRTRQKVPVASLIWQIIRTLNISKLSRKVKREIRPSHRLFASNCNI